MTNSSPSRLHIISLGCPKNQIDSEVMGGHALAAGMTIVGHPDQADVMIINTCGFIQAAKEEALEVILSLADEKRNYGRNLKLIVAGCLAQRYGKALLKEIPEVDLFIGTGEVGNIVKHLKKSNRAAVISKPDFLMTSRHERILPSGMTSAYLKISDGCSNCCTYCAIPSIRGRGRSRQPDDILREAQKLADRGIKEIILVGQDTTAYGRDLKSRPKLARLLDDMASIPKIRWIRLLYAHPAHISTDLLEAIARHKKICRYIDLPIQHIDDTILAAMNRKASGEQIRQIITQSREIMPNVVLRTSLIVGFPGETRKRFENLLCFIREIQFNHLGVFTYSREEGTVASQLTSRISEKEKESRRDVIMNEQADISFAINQRFIGSVQEVLVEEKTGRADYPFVGRCRMQAPEIDGVTYIKNSGAKIGKIVKCRIITADHYDLFGEILFDKHGRPDL